MLPNVQQGLTASHAGAPQRRSRQKVKQMRKDKYSEYMSEEDRLLAKKENQELGRFVFALLLACVYGVLAFFLVWRIHAVVPSLLNMYFPGEEQNDPFRLYRFVTIFVGGLAWFITFAALWFRLSRPGISLRRRLVTLAGWCAGCGFLFLMVELAYRILYLGW